MYKILVPIDGSGHSLKALNIACTLAEKYKACIVLLHVLTPGKTAEHVLGLSIARKFPPELTSKLAKSALSGNEPLNKATLHVVANTILRIAAGRAHRLGLETDIAPVIEGEPSRIILDTYQRLEISTIVMGSRGLAAIMPDRVSVSQTVFAKARCTCISVK